VTVDGNAQHAAEQVVRDSYGRVLALLASRTKDVAAAEDALSEALVAALEQWPRTGVPSNPTAWLMTAARRRLLDARRRHDVREAAAQTLELQLTALDGEDPMGIPDERLRLLFVCAHPAIESEARTPLMLQTVLGLDAVRIASAFCVAPKTMGQRLWRAKEKIRAAAIAFEVPGVGELDERASFVHEAIYAAFGTSWDDATDGADGANDLAHEALWLARLVCRLLPHSAESRGLLALMALSEARRRARRSDTGAYVPLHEQDVARWDHSLLAEGERTLAEAARLQRLGPFQLEAAIQSLHVAQRRDGRKDPAMLVQLYDGLMHLAPSLGVQVARAAALGQVNPEAALVALESIDVARRENHQPWWATRAGVLSALGRTDEAAEAYERAAGLTSDDAVRRWLLARGGRG
jgi:RNA polymerase sigma-70 factor, ECF subfamily